MKFQSAYNYDKKIGAQKLSPMVPDYGYTYNNLGERIFGKVGEHNAYADIQRDLANTDYSILKKYLFGVYGSNAPDVGVYGDRSIEVNDVIEAQEFLECVNGIYDNLPDVVKAKYGDVRSFINDYNAEDFKNYLSVIQAGNTNNQVDSGGKEDVKAE